MVVRYLSDAELYHHGIKGQKWGVRRYQNPDGSLTAAGQKRYNRIDEQAKRQSEWMDTLHEKAIANQEKGFNKSLSSIEKKMNKFEKGTARYDEQRLLYNDVKATKQTTMSAMASHNQRMKKAISSISEVKKLKLTDPKAAKAIAKSKEFKNLTAPYMKTYLNAYNGGSYAAYAVYQEMLPNLERYQKEHDEIYKKLNK